MLATPTGLMLITLKSLYFLSLNELVNFLLAGCPTLNSIVLSEELDKREHKHLSHQTHSCTMKPTE